MVVLFRTSSLFPLLSYWADLFYKASYSNLALAMFLRLQKEPFCNNSLTGSGFLDGFQHFNPFGAS